MLNADPEIVPNFLKRALSAAALFSVACQPHLEHAEYTVSLSNASIAGSSAKKLLELINSASPPPVSGISIEFIGKDNTRLKITFFHALILANSPFDLMVVDLIGPRISINDESCTLPQAEYHLKQYRKAAELSRSRAIILIQADSDVTLGSLYDYCVASSQAGITEYVLTLPAKARSLKERTDPATAK